MNTFLSPAQEAIKENYIAFTKESLAPVAKDIDSRSACLKEFMQMLGQKGYLGISVPKEYGGHGNPFTFCALFVEAVSHEEPGLGLSLAVHYAVIETIKKYGSDTQKSRFLPLLARGEVLGTLAFSEENAGTDYQAVAATLKKEGDSFVLDGKKLWVVNGQLSGLALVLSKNIEGEADPLAVSLLDCSQESQACSKDGSKMMGLQSAYVNTVDFKGSKFESANRLSGEKAGLIAAFALDVAKTVLAAAAVGLTFGAMNKAVEHARSREQFGKTIGQYQGIQWKLADMYTEGEAARLHVARASWSLESEPKSFPKYAAMCKWYAARVARQHSGEAMQVLGAAGLMEDCPVEKFYRDAKAMEICLGTSEGQKLQLVQELAI